MGVALQRAKRGLGATAPNPSVGAVIVKAGQIIAAGNTAEGGRPHAENLALKQAGSQAEGATMYVTLEPCCHIGLTPPCTEALIASGLSRIVIATKDSNPRVSGHGIEQLKSAAIAISYGVREAEARALNAGFFCAVEQKRPFVTLKLATTLDGKIASSTGKSMWITGQSARHYAHLLRAQHDAIMVGVNTVLADNPLLTCRLPGLEGRSPIRIIVDSNLRLPLDAALVKTSATVPVWVITCRESDRAEALRDLGVKVIAVGEDKEGRVAIRPLMAALASSGVTRLLVEGGGAIAASCLKAELVDSIIWMRAPLMLGSEAISAIGGLKSDNPALAPRWRCANITVLGEDIIETYIQTEKQS